MQILVRCTVVVRYFHQNPIFVYHTVLCNSRTTHRLKIMFSDRLTLLSLRIDNYEVLHSKIFFENGPGSGPVLAC